MLTDFLKNFRRQVRELLPLAALVFGYLVHAPLLSAAPGTAAGQDVRIRLADGLFEPRKAGEVSYRDAAVELWVPPLDGEGLRLHIRKNSARETSLELPTSSAQVESLYRYGNKAVVLSWMNGALATEAVVVDLDAAAIVDRFWGYAASPSPDGRYIAFIRFYSSHFVEDVEDQYRFYDLERDSSGNRSRTAAGSAPDSHIDAGGTLWPLERPIRDRENVYVTPPESAYRLGSELFWSEDSKRLAFASYQAQTMRVVLAAFPGDAMFLQTALPTVYVHALEGENAVCAGQCWSLRVDDARLRFAAEGVRARFVRNDARRSEVERFLPYRHFTVEPE